MKSYGDDSEGGEGSQDAEIQGPSSEPMPAMRALQGLYEEVRDVPPLFSEGCARGRRDWRDQEFVVAEPATHEPRTKNH